MSVRVVLVLFLMGAVAGAAQPPAGLKPDDPLIERRLKELLTNPATADADELLNLSALREFARYFSRVPNPTSGQRDTLNWLLKSKRLLPVLMMTIGEGDPPDNVLEVLRSLRADHRQQLDENPELAAAMCVVWDAPERYGPDPEVAKVDPTIVSSVFARLLKSLPRDDWGNAELLVYVADVELTDAELDWAAGRFGKEVNVSRVFASIPYAEGEWYDRRAFHERTQSDPDERAFVLPNIVKRGGPGADVAYATAQIARSAGIPAAIVRAAEAGDGAQPAWVAFVTSASPPAWDMYSARYTAHADWPGEVIDPQTYAPIDDSELALIAASARMPSSQRLASMALVKAADLAPAHQLMATFERAVESWPTNRRAWHTHAVMEAEGKLKLPDAQKSAELMEKHLLREFPEFLLALRLRTLQKSGTLDHAAGMTRLRRTFRDRQPLLAQIELAAGDRLREDKRRPESVAAYLQALQLSNESPATAFRALNRLDDLLRHMDDGVPRLQALYAEIFPKLTPPKQSRLGSSTPYYRIGARYAAVLDELKQPQPASAIRAKIGQVVLP